jgi:hypothetical protein
MEKVTLFKDRIKMTEDYRAGTLQSGWYRFFCGAEYIGYLTNQADAERETAAARENDPLPEYNPPITPYRGAQYFQAGDALFIGKLNLLTIIEKLSGKPKNDFKN